MDLKPLAMAFGVSVSVVVLSSVFGLFLWMVLRAGG